MEDLTVDWREFPMAVGQKLAEMQGRGRQMWPPLFRGVGNSHWGLETTLERSMETTTDTLKAYYRRIDRSKPVVESLTGKRWQDIPNSNEFELQLDQSGGPWLDRFMLKNPSIYEYLIYLRHHGFPSPLLDWTRSAYIAAFFAFDSMDRNAEFVAVYMYVRNFNHASTSDNNMFIVGKYIRTHPRHYLQQSNYSLCVGLQIKRDGDEVAGYDYRFMPHEGALGKDKSEMFLKILLPASERRTALFELDSMNVNPYSVYSSEESLIRTIARQQFLFDEPQSPGS
jgi:hypothetical protein